QASWGSTEERNDASPAPARDDGSDEATLPEDLLQIIRCSDENSPDRSALFHSVVGKLKRRQWTVEVIAALLEKYPGGVAQKYVGRIREEVKRSYTKVTNGSGATSGQTHGQTTPGPSAAAVSSSAPGARPGIGGAQAASTAPRVLPTIRLVDGQLPRVLKETE